MIDEWDWGYDDESLDYKNMYFILAKWRGGMFELRNGKKRDAEEKVHIFADYKEMPMQYQRHLDKIDEIIKIMDKYRKDIIVKKLKFDFNFDIVNVNIVEAGDE